MILKFYFLNTVHERIQWERKKENFHPQERFLKYKRLCENVKKLFQFLSPKVRAGSEPDTVTLYILNKYCSFPLAL